MRLSFGMWLLQLQSILETSRNGLLGIRVSRVCVGFPLTFLAAVLFCPMPIIQMLPLLVFDVTMRNHEHLKAIEGYSVTSECGT